MTAGRAGQLVTSALIVLVIAWLLYRLGFFRGFRFGVRAQAARRPVLYPAVVEDHDDYPPHG